MLKQVEMNKPTNFRVFFGILGLIAGAFLIGAIVIASGPNQDLSFKREIRSKRTLAELGQELGEISHWKNWFYLLDHVEAMSFGAQAAPTPPETAQSGSFLKLFMDPKKGERKKFALSTKITEYEPNHAIGWQILADSNGKLFKVFDSIFWKVELIPQSDQTVLIRGTEMAHTKSWRARIFGKIAERILMNQVFYPNLIQLADPKVEMVSPISGD